MTRSETQFADLATLIRKHPKVLKLLNEYGIHFCAGCYLTLSAGPARAAAYHGVLDVREFMRRLEFAIKDHPRRKHSRRTRTSKL